MTLEQRIQLIEALFESDVQKAAAIALPITEQIATALASGSSATLTVTKIVESLIPNGATYGADVLAAVTALEPALTELANKNSTIYTTDGIKGLLQRLGSEITMLIHAGKKPFGFYVKAFEIAFDA